MDIFEYVAMSLYFKNYDEGSMTADAFLDIATYDVDGKPTVETIDLEEWADLRRHQERFQDGETLNEDITVRDSYMVSTRPDFATGLMMPYIARSGAQGWEVVEFKTASEPAMGIALLKRKIQKE